jgi:hypothetical protein
MGTSIFSFIKNHLHNIAEFISLVVAVIYYPYLKKSFMKWFLPFLIFVFASELFIVYEHYYVAKQSTVGKNYIIGIAESIFYGYIFYNLSDYKKFKKIVLSMIFISVIGYILGFVLYGEESKYFRMNLILSGVLLTIVSLCYVYLRIVDTYSTNLVANPGFWIALGISLFFSGISIVYCLHDYIFRYNLNLFGIELYNIVPRVCCIILYLCISIAIILCKKKTKTSS